MSNAPESQSQAISGNTRSKMNTRKTSQQAQPVNKSNQVFVPTTGQGVDASDLVNFYNSNLINEMFAKNDKKF